jgi:hypothetical protein
VACLTSYATLGAEPFPGALTKLEEVGITVADSGAAVIEAPRPVCDAANLVMEGRLREAESVLSRIDAPALFRVRQEAIREASLAARTGLERSGVAETRAPDSHRGYGNVAVFQRDSFACRYCERKTVYLPVLQSLSSLFPKTFPYAPSWKFGIAHIIYWTHSASWDHVVARKRGGDDSWSNVVTACYQCNEIKNVTPLEVLGWKLHEPKPTSWDGLLGLSSALADIAARRKPRAEGAILVAPSQSQTVGKKLAGELKAGTIIRALIIGHVPLRLWAVDDVTNDEILLRTLWRRQQDGAFPIYSKRPIRITAAYISKVTLYATLQPTEASMSLPSRWQSQNDCGREQ